MTYPVLHDQHHLRRTRATSLHLSGTTDQPDRHRDRHAGAHMVPDDTQRVREMASPAGFEPATFRLEGGCSGPLSYGDSLAVQVTRERGGPTADWIAPRVSPHRTSARPTQTGPSTAAHAPDNLISLRDSFGVYLAASGSPKRREWPGSRRPPEASRAHRERSRPASPVFVPQAARGATDAGDRLGASWGCEPDAGTDPGTIGRFLSERLPDRGANQVPEDDR
jgi:hypothetical protein